MRVFILISWGWIVFASAMAADGPLLPTDPIQIFEDKTGVPSLWGIEIVGADLSKDAERIRAITEAGPQVSQTRQELDMLLARLGEADNALHTLDTRKRQLEEAEERLAHADVMLADVRGSLETLVSQKTELDFVLEKAAALALQARQAEALIDTLREERRLTDRVHSAISDLRRGERASGEKRISLPKVAAKEEEAV